MTHLVKHAGVWKESEPYVKHNGVWKPLDQGHIKDAGVWKEYYSGMAYPFSISGWASNNLQGWNLTNGTFYYSVGRGGVAVSGNYTTSIQRTFPAEMVKGLHIYASIKHLNPGGAGKNGLRKLMYRYGSGSWVTLASLPAGGYSSEEISGSFTNTSDQDITIRVDASDTGMPGFDNQSFEDWAIIGTVP